MIPEQQRYWIALLNLARTWTQDEAALSFLPPRQRDFESAPEWPRPKALAYLLNNLELLRESYDRLTAGEVPELEQIGHVLEPLRLHLAAWSSPAEVRHAAKAKAELGGRLEVLRVEADHATFNPGTRYIRQTIQRAFYYFAQYVDERLSDWEWPLVAPGRWHVAPDPHGSGDLVLLPPRTP